ncbi:hypothetical protein TorRG33x02_160170 [Trema orientale]|uniref:Uncharacterized protein n=1 Tax=Trema orientale TaxID=63057 RepID=A0A2P5ERL6_TREOI|nr:hypothetical protein TorRG33x02_160170 [Trema orientale]
MESTQLQMKMLPLFALVMNEPAIIEHKLAPFYSLYTKEIQYSQSVYVMLFGSEIEYPIYGPKFEDHNEKDMSNDDPRAENFDYKQPKFRGSFCKQEGDTTRVDDDCVENLNLKPNISLGSSERKALNGGLKQECPGISPETVLNRRERGKLRKQCRNAVAKDHRGPSEFWYRTRSISRVKEEEEEVQELGNANISRTSKPKENTNKSHSCDLPVKCEEDNEMIVPRSFSYSKSRRP